MNFEQYLKEHVLTEMPTLFKSSGVKAEWNKHYLEKLESKVNGIKAEIDEELADGYIIQAYPLSNSKTIFIKKDDEIMLYATLLKSTLPLKGSTVGGINKKQGLPSYIVEDLYDFIVENIAENNTIITDDIQSYGGKSLWKRVLKNNHGTAEIGVYNTKENKKEDICEDDADFESWYKKTEEYAYDEDVTSNSYYYVYYISL